MIRVPAISARSVALFLGLWTMLAVTVAFLGAAGAQIADRVVVPVTSGGSTSTYSGWS